MARIFIWTRRSIWEYNIPKRQLRDLLPKDDRFQFVAPVIATTTNDGGTEFEYYYLSPAHMDSHKKYPVVLDNSLANIYELSGQFLANAGVFYVVPGNFGLTDWTIVPSEEQVMAVYHVLLKNPNVDTNRVYLHGRSISSWVACQLVHDYPDLWRGLILMSPTTWPNLPLSSSHKPWFFVSVGDDDDHKEAPEMSEKFALRAAQMGFPVRLDYHHATHVYSSQQYLDSFKKAVEMISMDH